MINAITTLFGAAAKRLGYLQLEEKIIPNVAPQSFPLLSSWLEGRKISECMQTSLIVQKKETLTEVYVRPGLFTSSHQSLLFRSAMKQRKYRSLSQLQMRTYCTQGKTTRDIINAWPFARVNTGTIVKQGGRGAFILLFAVILGWIYCESHPEEEICESGRTLFGIKKKISRIPISASHCVLRKAPIEKIRSLFSTSKEEHPIVAIVGDPASGKTELSKQYAREYKNAYHHIWFVQVETWEKAYQDLAAEWKVFSPEEITLMGGMEKVSMDLIIAKVHHLFTHSGRKKSLIIFENAPEGFIKNQLKGQLPTHTDILITSRSSAWETTVNLSSDKDSQLTLDEGVTILRSWIEGKQWNVTEAEEIVKRFNYSPVPIAQAGRYLYKTKEKIEKYIPLFEQNKQEILKGGVLEGDIDIIVSLKIATNQVTPEARKLLYYCAFLPAKNIPREFLEKLFDANKLNEYISILDTLILADTTTISIHDLFQEIIEGQVSSQKKELLSDLGKASDDFEEFLLKHPKKALPIFQQTLADNEQRTNPDERRIVEISNWLGIVCRSLGDYPRSLEYQKKFLENSEKISGKEHPDTATSYNNVGVSLGDLGRYEEALEYQKKSLEISEKVFGKEDPSTATSYNNVGWSLANLGRYEEALEYQKKSLAIFEKNLGKEHPYTASSYSNIGGSLEGLGRYEEALEYQKKSLEIRKKVLGKEHPDTAKSLNNVGESLGDLGRYEEALEYQKKSVEICEKIFGKEHPNTAKSFNNVGGNLGNLGHYEEALEYQKKSLEICEKVLGKEHPDTAKSLNNVGGSLGDLGRHEEALEYQKKSLEIFEKVLGKEHPDTALSYNNIGRSLGDLGHHEEALEYKKKSLEIFEKVFGKEHPHTALSYNNIGRSLGDLGHHEEALEYKKKSLEIRKKVLGKEHSDTAMSYNNVGESLSNLGRQEEALENFQKAFQISCKVNQKYPLQKQSLNNLINCLKNQTDREQCEGVKQEALSVCIDKFGKDDPFTQLLEKSCNKYIAREHTQTT